MTRPLTDRARYGHTVKALKTSRQPWTWIVLDSEAWREPVGGGAERQTFACAAAVCMRRHERARTTWRADLWGEFTDTGDLWRWAAARCPRKSRTILVAHNLAYDLRVTHAFAELGATGFTLHNFGIDQGSVWLVWQRDDGAALCMVDSLSWWQISLDRIATAMGTQKLPLPDPELHRRGMLGERDELAGLAERCRRDVEILSDAWRTYVNWLAREELGPWRMSGASQSWAAWRRRFYPDEPLFVRDPLNATGMREFERKSAWTGRTEAWKVGRHELVHEWDFAHAYASVARDHDLPREQVAYIDELDVPKWERIRASGYAILSVCDVRTTTPVVPAQGPDGILWPVGEFRSVLWDCEIAEALANGADVRLWHSQYYEAAPIMVDVATWICDLLDGRRKLPAVLAPIVKHWSRTLVGRSAMTFPKWRRHITLAAGEMEDAYPPLQLVPRDGDERIRRTLRVGGQVFADTGDAEPSDAAPFVQSNVMAHARVRLWRAMQSAGLDHVLYVDTDSLIVDGTGDWRLRRAHIPDLCHKAKYSEVEILGPRQLYLDGQLRMAGLPGARDAIRVGPGEYEVTVWPSLVGSMEAGQHDHVVVRRQRVKVRGVDSRRVHRDDGTTTPVELGECNANS